MLNAATFLRRPNPLLLIAKEVIQNNTFFIPTQLVILFQYQSKVVTQIVPFQAISLLICYVLLYLFSYCTFCYR